MTDPNVESPDLEGAGGNQTPVSQKKDESIAGAPQSSQELLLIRQELAQTRSELKGLQSRQDKTQNETQRFMEEVKGHVAKGKTLDEAEQIVLKDRQVAEKDQLLQQIAERLGIGNSPQNVTGNGGNAADEAQKVFAEYEISPNDPEATPLLSLKGEELVRKVSQLAIRRAKSQSVDSSEAPSMSGNPPPPVGVKQATEQYQKDMVNAPRGKSGDRTRQELKEKARKAGVLVDTIGFV